MRTLFNKQQSMQKTMDYILIHFIEAENILLTTEQVDYKSFCIICFVDRMFVSPPNHILKP